MGIYHYLFKERSFIFGNGQDHASGIGLALIGGTMALGPIVPVTAAALLGAGLAAEGAYKLTRGALRSIPHRPSTPKPIRLPPPLPKPTQDDLHRAALEKFRKNVEMIDNSPLPDEMKLALKRRETELLAEMIQEIMGV